MTLKTAEVRSKLRTAIRAHVLINTGGSKLTPAIKAFRADDNKTEEDGTVEKDTLERSNSVKSLTDKDKRVSRIALTR